MRDVVKLTLIPGDMSKCAKRKYDCDSSQTLRSDVSKFCFHTDCYLCGEWVDQEKIKRHPNNNDYEFSRVMLIQVKATITKICAERRADKVDEWADVVSHRLSCIYDMPAEEAMYHRRCYQYFMSPRDLKLDAPSTTTGGMVLKKRGRPSGAVDQEKKSTFMHVIEYLENNDDETVTLDELHEIMEKEAGGGEVYSKRSPQRQLYAHYGSIVSITSSKRQSLIVMLSSNVKQLIQEAHHN